MQPALKKYILKFLLLTVLIIPATQNNAQRLQKATDSLSNLLNKTVSDTDYLRLTYQLGRAQFHGGDIYGGIAQLQKSLHLAYKIKYFAYASDAMIIMANAYITLERYDSVFTLLESAMKFAVDLKQEDNIANINGNYLYLYNMLGDTKKALEFGFKAIEGFEKSKNVEVNMLSVYAWIEIGKIFEVEKQYDKALYYYNKSLAKGKTNIHRYYILPALLNLGNIYLQQNQPERSDSFYNKVLENKQAPKGERHYRMWALLGLSDVEIHKKNYPKAIMYSRDALQIAKEFNLNINIDNCLCKIGHAYLLNSQYDSSEAYLKHALEMALKSEGWNTINDSYRYLSELFEKQNKYKEALYYDRLYKNISDSIYNKSKVAAINNLEALYQTNKKEKEIIRLQANNTEKQLELFKRNELLWITAIIIGALLIVFLVQWRTVKNKNMIGKQQQKVMILKSMLEGQNKERTRIAKDLHDGLGGLFSTIKMHLSTLQHENEFLKQDDLFQKSYKLIDTASEDLRHIAHNMMPEVLQKLGLMQALKDLCSTINAKNSLQVSLLDYGMEERLSLQTEIIIYRIVQELLSNVIKHSNATEAILQFNRSGNNINITVEDNGSGFVVQSPKDKLHTGIDIIKERVNFLNGDISIDSQPGIGTTVMISFCTENKNEI
jgi:signal transduction histidine kinase